MLGVVQDVFPDNNNVPLLAASYQSTVTGAAVPETDKFTVPVPHLSPPTAVPPVGKSFMVAVTGILAELKQPVVEFLNCA